MLTSLKPYKFTVYDGSKFVAEHTYQLGLVAWVQFLRYARYFNVFWE